MTIYYEVPRSFKEWRSFAQYSITECSVTFAVTQRTIKNWESGRIKAPRSVIICLMLFSGRLDHLGKRWQGFRITAECIEAPNGDFVRCEEISALRYAMQALEIDRLRRCRMNEATTGTADFSNVSFIDQAPKPSPQAKLPELQTIKKLIVNAH